MRKHKDSKLNKMLLLITALVMVLLLSGCRTRISNNTEVASTISDEDGWLQDSYQMRRDDLGMPVAKKPFITGSSDEELDGYDDYDVEDGELVKLEELPPAKYTGPVDFKFVKDAIRLSFADQARFAAETIRRINANGRFNTIDYGGPA